MIMMIPNGSFSSGQVKTLFKPRPIVNYHTAVASNPISLRPKQGSTLFVNNSRSANQSHGRGQSSVPPSSRLRNQSVVVLSDPPPVGQPVVRTRMNYDNLSERIETLAHQANAQRSCISILESQLAAAQQTSPGGEEQSDPDAIVSNQTSRRLEEEFKELSLDLKRYQAKCDTLKTIRTQLEDQLEKTLKEKDRVTLDLKDTKNFASNLESTKMRIEEELQDSVGECKEYKQKIEDMGKEINDLKTEISEEREKSSKLEELLSTAQEALLTNESQLQKRIQELSSALKKLEASESKRKEIGKEVEKLRSKISNLEKEVKWLQNSPRAKTPSVRQDDLIPCKPRGSAVSCHHSSECLDQPSLTHELNTSEKEGLHSPECSRRSILARNKNSFNSGDIENIESDIEKLLRISKQETSYIMNMIKDLRYRRCEAT